MAPTGGQRWFEQSSKPKDERTKLCGPAYERGRDKSGPQRAGSAPSSLVMGGRRVRVQRPRVRDDNGEVTLPSWQSFLQDEPSE